MMDTNITDEQIMEVINSMENGMKGFLKQWGLLQFGHAVSKLAPAPESQPGALDMVPTHEGPDVPKAWAKAVYEGWRAQAGIIHDFDAFMTKYGRFLSLENIQACASHARGGPAMREALAALSAPAAPVPAASEGWTENNGKQPVLDGARVDVEFINGERQANLSADEFDWARNTDEIEAGWEIVRWRPAAPAASDKAEG